MATRQIFSALDRTGDSTVSSQYFLGFLRRNGLQKDDPRLASMHAQLASKYAHAHSRTRTRSFCRPPSSPLSLLARMPAAFGPPPTPPPHRALDTLPCLYYSADAPLRCAMPAIPQAAIGGADGDVMLTIDQFAEATASRNPPLATKNLLEDTDGLRRPP